jgi:hypothetical protein
MWRPIREPSSLERGAHQRFKHGGGGRSERELVGVGHEFAVISEP